MGGGQSVAPMIMTDIGFDGTNITVQPDDPTLVDSPVVLQPLAPPDQFDPSKPWSVLNGTAYNFQYGWNPAGYITLPAGSAIWIQVLSEDAGLETYLRPPAYSSGPTWPQVFAANGNRWEFQGFMQHNAYAVVNPQQTTYSATYCVYIGNATTGSPLPGYGSADVTWTWLGAPTWSTTTGGSWTQDGNWSTGSAPSQPGVCVIVGTGTTAPLQITLAGQQTVGSLIFANSASNSTGYELSDGTLVLDNSGTDARITVTGGSHSIAASVTLNDNLVITPSAGTALEIDGAVGESSVGKSLTLSGPGTLVLSGSNSYTGGTIVTEGTLEIANPGALPDGGSLTVGAGGTFIFDPSAAGSPLVASPDSVGAAVPEPSTLALLAAGAIGIVGYGLRQRLARRTAMPSAFDQQPRTAAILSFPAQSSPASAARRTA